METYSHRPFFAYVCYMDVNRTFHDRWLNYGFLQKKAPLTEVRQAYDTGLTELDGQIGTLFAELERRGALRNTLVIITSDHGESFGEETGDHDPMGHGTSLYPEQTRVPLFVVFPGRTPAGRRETGLASIRQIPKTITDLLDLPDTPFAGPSLFSPVDRVAGRAQIDPAELLITLRYADSEMEAFLWDNWLYIRNQTACSVTDRRVVRSGSGFGSQS